MKRKNTRINNREIRKTGNNKNKWKGKVQTRMKNKKKNNNEIKKTSNKKKKYCKEE